MDLCAAPGSWSQVLARKLVKHDNNKHEKIIDHVTDHLDKLNVQDQNDQVHIVAVDIQTMAPIDGVKIIQGDITCDETARQVISQFDGSKAQLVVCDGAPDVTGHHDLDEFIQAQLLNAALLITTTILEQGGTFVAKIFRTNDISRLMYHMRCFFSSVQVVKPSSSRSSSLESFVVCRNFHLPKDLGNHENVARYMLEKCSFASFLK